ncbi:hypothetical protein [Streptomyces luteireticuli]|uniref:hypothetical protein n=1 Tax=Streptomyces luteireticuli TaxID=173858 RepID=UPI0031D22A4A
MRRLEAAESDRSALHVRLGLAAEIVDTVQRYSGSVIGHARSAGASWEDIGSAAGKTAAMARARWNSAQLTRLFSPVRVPPPGRPGRTGTSRHGVALTHPQAFGEALTHLAQVSGLAVAEAARRADLPPTELLRVLDGEVVSPWPVAHMLTTVFGGDPREVRIVWEGAQGIRRSSRRPAGEAAEELRRALRGLRLAARNPSPMDLSLSARLGVALVEGVFAGTVLPDWHTTAALASAMGADPEILRGTWELAAEVPYPPTGSPGAPSVP